MTSRYKKYYLLASLYFCEGLPFAIVVAMPVVYLKNCGADNAFITFWTGILALPWSLKGIWAPMLDRAQEFRRWIVITQILCSLLCLALCCLNYTHFDYHLLLIIFGLTGFVAATQDLSIDAYYLSTFKISDQANLMWLRNTAFRIAYLLGAGLFVSLAGFVTEQNWLGHTALAGWSLVFGICAVLMATASLFNYLALKTAVVEPDRYANDTDHSIEVDSGLLAAIKAMLKLPGIFRIIIYTLVFRIGDAFLSAMAQPFLLDSVAAGGLGLKTSVVGLIYGTFGAASLIVGGVVGGLFLSKTGARKLLIPFSLLQSISILGYYYLSVNHLGVSAVCAINSFEQICFGLTTSCYSVVLLTAVDHRYKATHFAIICAVMNLGLMIPGMMSGALSDRLGYENFFLLSFALSLIGPFTSLLLPTHKLLEQKTVDAS